MLEIYLPDDEYYNEETNCFENKKAYKFELEHSLNSLSKWEEHYKKPLLEASDGMSMPELKYYIKCMDVKGDASLEQIDRLGEKEFSRIKEYMIDSHTATTVSDKQKKSGRKEIITAEVIYYWMIALEIPFECEHWHLNKLLTLIRVCGVKNNPKKMNKKDSMMEYMRLNNIRRGKI